MTKKDYEAIADAIFGAQGQVTSTIDTDGKPVRYVDESSLMRNLSVVFTRDNPRFDAARFWKAVRG